LSVYYEGGFADGAIEVAGGGGDGDACALFVILMMW